jgi:hypothetical protein
MRKALLPDLAELGSLLWYGPFLLAGAGSRKGLHYEYVGVGFQGRWLDPMPAISGYMGKFARGLLKPEAFAEGSGSEKNSLVCMEEPSNYPRLDGEGGKT